MKERAPGLALVAGAVLLVVGVLLSLTVGKGDIALSQVVPAFFDFDPTDPDQITVRQLRMPRAMLAVLVGAALAVSGALVQTLTRNPLAEPGLLGVTAGASFAVVVLTQLGLETQVTTLLAACLGAGLAALLVYLVGRADPLRLVLAGVALTAVLAGFSISIRLLDPEVFDTYRFWSVGSLAGREQLPLLLPCLVLCGALIAALLLGRSLGAVVLGDDIAHGLGVSVVRTRVLTLVVATLLAGVATAVAGPIAFVGLIVPHVVRRFAAGSINWLIGLCLIGGPLLMVLSDVIARLLLPTGEVPVAIVTAVLGGPVLIWVVRRHGAVGV